MPTPNQSTRKVTPVHNPGRLVALHHIHWLTLPYHGSMVSISRDSGPNRADKLMPPVPPQKVHVAALIGSDASETHGFSAQGLILATFDQRKFRSNLIRTPSLSSKPSSFQPTSPKNHTTRGKQSSSPLANEVADTFAAAMSG
jgi:hypothetical protein